MNMTVEHIPRSKGLEEPAERDKSPMAVIFPVSKLPWGGVGKENVQISPMDNLIPHQTGNETKNFPVHFPVSKLVFSAIVKNTASQTYNKEFAFGLYALAANVG